MARNLLALSLQRTYKRGNASTPFRHRLSHHLDLVHWLANDLRGSGSEEVRDPKFADLAPVHQGRKPEHLQPSRSEVREFYRQAEPLLEHPRFWIDEAKRQALAGSIEVVCRERSYTVWACAILANHVHMVIRRHRDDGATMWRSIAAATCLHLRDFRDVGQRHPVWAARPYKMYLWTPYDVRTRVTYVESGEGGFASAAVRFCHALRQWALSWTEAASVTKGTCKQGAAPNSSTGIHGSASLHVGDWGRWAARQSRRDVA